MKKLHSAAYCNYWTDNRFTFPLGVATYTRLDTSDIEPSEILLGDEFDVDYHVTELQGSHMIAMLPSAENLQHIRHFSASWNGLDVLDLVFVPSADGLQLTRHWSASSWDDSDAIDVTFEPGVWEVGDLFPVSPLSGPKDDGYLHWLGFQDQVKFHTDRIMEDMASPLKRGHHVLDPRIGQGLYGALIVLIAQTLHMYCDFPGIFES